MKIDSLTTPVGTTLIKGSRSTSSSKTESSSSDEVQLSALGTQLSGSDSDYPFDAARVAEIKQAIANGQFTINASAISDRLIASAQEFLAINR
ncbi:flagellar biosynthesis anti-sigma factor FlgM [Propionivibrio dicarboxylicus]|uniref:Negative regulator of flagellin synthesis n=1 Tax=Propionivibrio dicarboxylicus TaxID=83767 RepID=A0A1G8HFE0_9RHOO|nr:flagellar biosynthesis anti-sigma factor FlgM [Propionivibrio dicarboxylicus]SDI05378.1 anti-sigma-28 factor, FlgM family [Propionivibrio dicarboxylicus]